MGAPSVMSDSEKEDGGRSSPIQSRHEKSLGLLTTKFVEMLKSAEGGLLDLKKVAASVGGRGDEWGTWLI